MQNIINIDKDNNYTNYLVSKIFKAALFHCDPTNFNFELVNIECLKLRLILFEKKDEINKNIEINLFDFIRGLLLNLHDELNNEIKKNDEPGSNDINIEEDNNNENIDYTNEQSVLSSCAKDYFGIYRSKISEQFYFVNKTIIECPECQNIIKYSTTIVFACSLYPYRASIYLKKNEININDLFKHFRKKRLFLDENINCQYCGKIQKDANRTNMFYNSPLNLIVQLRYDIKDENKFKVNIDELINMQEFVERKDISKWNYRLVGAIFEEKKENENRKYVSINKNENGQWYYFNGDSIQISSLNNLINHGRVRLLTYSSI